MSEKLDCWGVVELMGHQRAAGRISEQNVAGAALLRIDIPEGDAFRTVFYGSSAIYALHITDEATARAAAAAGEKRPLFAFALDRPRLVKPVEVDMNGDDPIGGPRDDDDVGRRFE